ncbi:hypothetical protein GCM10010493_35140 [Streptomyces lavendulae subsp. grasserius]
MTVSFQNVHAGHSYTFRSQVSAYFSECSAKYRWNAEDRTVATVVLTHADAANLLQGLAHGAA